MRGIPPSQDVAFPGRVAVIAALVLLVALWTVACGAGATTTTSGGAANSTSSSTTSTTATSSSSPTDSVPTTVTSLSGSDDWPTYHHDAARSGVSSDQQALGSVKAAWTSASLDGDIYAEPLIVGERVIVATEGNSVYALDAASGQTAWRAALGDPVPGNALPCGNIDPSGITGTPVVDVDGSTIYVVAFLKAGIQHELFALDLQTGAVRWHRPIDPPGLSPLVEQERGALTLVGGRVYVPFGGLWGDCGQYQGAVVSAAADGSGDITSYIVPTSRMAGIWNPAGPVVDGHGDLLVTTGNSESQGTFDYGNSVIMLSPQLQVLDYFAPSDWVDLNAGDVDLGSLGPVLLADGRVLAVGKSGDAYLLDGGNLGKVGGSLDSTNIGSSAFGAAATTGTAVFVPCSGRLVGLDISGDTIEVAWKISGGSGPPIIAAGVVWSLGNDGLLQAIDPASGAVKFSAQLDNPVSRFVSLAAAGGRLFVPDGTKISAFSLR